MNNVITIITMRHSYIFSLSKSIIHDKQPRAPVNLHRIDFTSKNDYRTSFLHRGQAMANRDIILYPKPFAFPPEIAFLMPVHPVQRSPLVFGVKSRRMELETLFNSIYGHNSAILDGFDMTLIPTTKVTLKNHFFFVIQIPSRYSSFPITSVSLLCVEF